MPLHTWQNNYYKCFILTLLLKNIEFGPVNIQFHFVLSYFFFLFWVARTFLNKRGPEDGSNAAIDVQDLMVNPKENKGCGC